VGTASAVSPETVRPAAQLHEDLVEPETASRQEHELREILDLVPHQIVVLGAQAAKKLSASSECTMSW
jgi:hypothetical protein